MLILIFNRGKYKDKAEARWRDICACLADVGFQLDTRRLTKELQALILTASPKEICKWIGTARSADFLERGLLTDDVLRQIAALPRHGPMVDERWTSIVASVFKPEYETVQVQERLRIMNRVALHTLQDHKLYPSSKSSGQPFIDTIFPLHDGKESGLLSSTFTTINLSSDLVQKIRNLYGEKVAYVFAFQQFMIKWLLWITPWSLVPFLIPPLSLRHTALIIAWGCGMTADWSIRSDNLTLMWATRHASDEEREMDPRYPLHLLPSSPTILDRSQSQTFSIETRVDSDGVKRPWSRWTRRLFLSVPIFLSLFVFLLVIQLLNFILEEILTQKAPNSYWTWLPTILGLALIQPITIILDRMQPWITRLEFYGAAKSRQQRENDQLVKRFILYVLSGLSSFLFSLFVRIPLTSEKVRTAAKVDSYSTFSFSWGDATTVVEDMASRAKTFVIGWQATDFLLSIGSNLLIRWWSFAASSKDLQHDALARQIYQEYTMPPFEPYDEFLSMGAPLVFLLFFSILEPSIIPVALITTIFDARARLYKALKFSRKEVPERIENLGYLQGALRWSTFVATICNASLVGMLGKHAGWTTVLSCNMAAHYLFVFGVWLSTRLQSSSVLDLQQADEKWQRITRSAVMSQVLPQVTDVTDSKLHLQIPTPKPTSEEWENRLGAVWTAMNDKTE